MSTKMATFLMLLVTAILITSAATYSICIHHDSNKLIDEDVFKRHVCPDSKAQSLKTPLPSSPTRPNENALWEARLKLMTKYEYAPLNFAENGKPAAGDLAIYLKERAENSLQMYKFNENHYRVELRRTILEMEANHPLSVPNSGDLRNPDGTDGLTGVPLLWRSDSVHSDNPQLLHDWARIDVLTWYAARGVFASNSVKSSFGRAQQP